MQWRQTRTLKENEGGIGPWPRSRRPVRPSAPLSHSVARPIPGPVPPPATRALRGARTHRPPASRRRGAPVAAPRRPDTAGVFTGFYCGHLQRAFAGRHLWLFGIRGGVQLFAPACNVSRPWRLFVVTGSETGCHPGPRLRIPSRHTPKGPMSYPTSPLPVFQTATARLMPRNLTRASSGLATLAADAGG